MSRISRVTQKIFGSSAGTDQISVFGSLAAGSPAYTTSAATAQSLSNFATGWFAAIIGNGSPAKQDMNSVFFILTTQLAYLLQSGVAEWDTGTTYYKGQIVSSGVSTSGILLYYSITDNNTNHALTDVTNWVPVISTSIQTQMVGYNVTLGDKTIIGNASGGTFGIHLPDAATSTGVDFVAKKSSADTSGNAITLDCTTGGQTIDGVASISLSQPGQFCRVVSDGSNYHIVGAG